MLALSWLAAARGTWLLGMATFPIVLAALLLTESAAWVYGVLGALLSIVGGVFFGVGWKVMLDVAFLQFVALGSWFVVRVFYQTERHLRQQLNQSRTGIEIGRMTTAALSPDAIVQKAVQRIQQTFNYYHVGLFTLQPESDTAILVGAAGEHVEELMHHHQGVSVMSSRAVAAAIRRRENVLVSSWEKSQDRRGREVKFTHNQLYSRAELALPLMVGTQVLGVLDIHRSDIQPFSDLDMHILEGLAGNIANTLNISLLLEDRERTNTALAGANDEIKLLNERLQAENMRMEAELDVTQRLQQMLLPVPEELQRFDNVDLVGFMQPAEEVGGDYYDVLQYDGHIKIGIGDVTGHGLESGVVMLMLQTAVRTLLADGVTDMRRFMDVLNRTLYDNILRMNVDRSLSLAVLDYEKGLVRLSGQHEQLIVVRKDGAVELQDTLDLGFPVGIIEDIADFVGEIRVTLAAGDGVVLYSDGITEAENVAGDFYGLPRLCQVVSQNWLGPAEAIKDAVITDVYTFIGQQKIYDDLTLLVLKQ